MIINQIGLECEYWLMRDDEIIEAPAYNFPADEMGFLIEIRSAWGTDPNRIVETLEVALECERAKARGLGLEIECEAYKIVAPEWQEYIAKKYKHDEMADFTENIYGKTDVSHHTGFLLDKATAGCHVHFSRWDTEKERYVIFTKVEIYFIVSEMDKVFGGKIGEVGRLIGEWESKTAHGGFEYRSLPCTAPLFDVAEYALELLDDVSKHL